MIDDPCSVCGLPRPVRGCPRNAHWHVDTVFAPFEYSVPLAHRIHALKFNGARKLGRALSLLMADLVDSAVAEVDALIAVPLHERRLRHRGYNQAMEIARSLSAELGLPLITRGVERCRVTEPQIALGAPRRRENLQHAFKTEREFGGYRLAVVDDVITTGATVNSLAQSLSAAGAETIDAWSVARTPI